MSRHRCSRSLALRKCDLRCKKSWEVNLFHPLLVFSWQRRRFPLLALVESTLAAAQWLAHERSHEENMKGSCRSWLLVLLALALGGAGFATVFGTVRGIVHDPQHRPVGGADVVL